MTHAAFTRCLIRFKELSRELHRFTREDWDRFNPELPAIWVQQQAICADVLAHGTEFQISVFDEDMEPGMKAFMREARKPTG